MFSEKRGADLVLYKLKKDSPDRLRHSPATYRESLYVYQKMCLLLTLLQYYRSLPTVA